jgi:pilus assembly protein Flp/PilA
MRSVELKRTGHVESPAKDAQSTWTKFVADDGGATSIEYALIGGLVSIGIVASVTQIGTTISNFFLGSTTWFTSGGA